MRSSNAWTMKPWQRSEWRLGFNSVLVIIDFIEKHPFIPGFEEEEKTPQNTLFSEEEKKLGTCTRPLMHSRGDGGGGTTGKYEWKSQNNIKSMSNNLIFFKGLELGFREGQRRCSKLSARVSPHKPCQKKKKYCWKDLALATSYTNDSKDVRVRVTHLYDNFVINIVLMV